MINCHIGEAGGDGDVKVRSCDPELVWAMKPRNFPGHETMDRAIVIACRWWDEPPSPSWVLDHALSFKPSHLLGVDEESPVWTELGPSTRR